MQVSSKNFQHACLSLWNDSPCLLHQWIEALLHLLSSLDVLTPSLAASLPTLPHAPVFDRNSKANRFDKCLIFASSGSQSSIERTLCCLLVWRARSPSFFLKSQGLHMGLRCRLIVSIPTKTHSTGIEPKSFGAALPCSGNGGEPEEKKFQKKMHLGELSGSC